MKRYPLHMLLKLRAHRTGKARMVVLEKQAAVRTCKDKCERIQAGIRTLEDERVTQRRKLLDPPPAGVSFQAALEQRELYIDLIGERIVVEQRNLQQAQEQLQAAEKKLEEAKQAYFRAKAREDALEKRKGVWRDEQVALEGRKEEDAAADLIQAARSISGPH